MSKVGVARIFIASVRVPRTFSSLHFSDPQLRIARLGCLLGDANANFSGQLQTRHALDLFILRD